MLDRLIGTCIAVLAAAVAIYVAVRLIESVAATLLIIVAVIGSVGIAGFVARLLWRRNRSDRW
jgi:preprotein translocase subunit SecF